MERYQDLSDRELVVTAPVVLSKADVLEFRKKIVLLIEDLKEIVTQSKSEEIMTLNIDWTRASGN